MNKTAAYWREWKKRNPLFNTWSSIKDRCLNPRCQAYRYYGGRGITMHQPWIDSRATFEAWILGNLGPRPEGHTLDRIDVNGNYEPGNLRWADRKTQIANTRPQINKRRVTELEDQLALYRRICLN